MTNTIGGTTINEYYVEKHGANPVFAGAVDAADLAAEGARMSQKRDARLSGIVDGGVKPLYPVCTK